MSMFSFGAGLLIATRTDIANQTPLPFGTLQDVSVEFSGTNKDLFGRKRFPVLTQAGQAKIQCKAKSGELSANLFNSVFFGGTVTAGQTAMADSEKVVVPIAPGPYTAVVANAATFIADEGVFYASGANAGLPLKRGTGAPANAGEYSVDVATGTYTFAAADTGAAVFVTYTYGVAGSGQKITLVNPVLGTAPIFAVALMTQANTPTGIKTAVLNLRACISSKLSLATKIEDFTVPELDFSAMADATDTVFDWSFNEVS